MWAIGHSDLHSLLGDFPSVSNRDVGMEIILLDLVVDSITEGFSLRLVGSFLSFRPTIGMVRKWVYNRWKMKGSIEVTKMVGSLFLFKISHEEDEN